MSLSILYAIFLEPLESLYCFVFDICQKYSGHSVLVALLMLSVISSLVLAAVERKAAKYVNQEKLIQSILAKQIAKIKAQFSGIERQQEIKYLYQRYSYNPLYSARASLGVLAQLPFLLGAYLMLLHDEELVGVSVPGIADLSQPDGLLFGLNLLPCLMLAVNASNSLLSTWFTRKEKLTALTIGLVFFVLLYAAPSCMLIYWTTNNVLQLLRTLRRRYVPRKSSSQRLGKRIAELGGKLGISATAKNTVLITPRTAGFSLLALIGLTCAWLLARHGAIISNYCTLDEAQSQIPDLNCMDSIPGMIYELPNFTTVFSCLLGVALLGLLYVILKSAVKELKAHGIKHVFKNCGKCAGVSLIIGLATVVVILCNSMSLTGTPGIIAIGLALLTLIIACLPVRQEVLAYLMPDAAVLNKSKALFMPAAMIITGLAIVYAPTMLFLSDPRAFGLSFGELITDNLKFLWFLWFTLGFGYYIATGRVRVIASYVITVTAVVALIYEFVLVLKMGSMQFFTFSNINFITFEWLKRDQDLAVILLAFTAVYLLFRMRKLRITSTIFCVFCAYIYVWPFAGYLANAEEIDEITMRSHENSGSDAPQHVKDFFKFSKDDNVLVIALDAFTGGNMREIIAQHPELKDDLEGFTWYEDAMTAGQSTARGMQVCIGGEEVDPVRMQHDNGMPIAERINKGWAEFLNYLTDKGYQVNVHEPTWLRNSLIAKHLKSDDYRLLNDYSWEQGFWEPTSQLKYYAEVFSQKALDPNGHIDIHRFSKMYGLYSILPNWKKYKIYKYGAWGKSSNYTKVIGVSKALQYSSSEIMPSLSSTDAASPQYKVIHLAVTHYPYNMNGKCEIDYDNFFKSISSDGTIPGHLNMEYCQLKSLGKFFRWMKDKGIYDKTQIILTSDHGEHVLTKSTDDSRLYALGIGVQNPGYFACKNAAYALMLVKERNARHQFTVNSEYLMSNMDIPLLIKQGLGDELKYKPYLNSDRVRIDVQAAGESKFTQHHSAAFVVRGSMFDKFHWTEVIDQKEVQELWKLLYDHE